MPTEDQKEPFATQVQRLGLRSGRDSNMEMKTKDKKILPQNFEIWIRLVFAQWISFYFKSSRFTSIYPRQVAEFHRNNGSDYQIASFSPGFIWMPQTVSICMDNRTRSLFCKLVVAQVGAKRKSNRYHNTNIPPQRQAQNEFDLRFKFHYYAKRLLGLVLPKLMRRGSYSQQDTEDPIYMHKNQLHIQTNIKACKYINLDFSFSPTHWSSNPVFTTGNNFFYQFLLLLTFKTSIRYSCFQAKLTNHSIVQNGFLKLQSTPKNICSVYRYDEFTFRGQM